jgi:hypothetical protein
MPAKTVRSFRLLATAIAICLSLISTSCTTEPVNNDAIKNITAKYPNLTPKQYKAINLALKKLSQDQLNLKDKPVTIAEQVLAVQKTSPNLTAYQVVDVVSLASDALSKNKSEVERLAQKATATENATLNDSNAARKATAQATAAVTASDVPGFSGVTSGGFNYSSRAALVKLRLIAGDTEIFPDSIENNHYLGIEVSLTGPAGSDSTQDYVTAQLLMRDNGLLNVYFSPFTQNVSKWANWATIAKLDKPVGTRPTAVNRFYFSMSDLASQLKTIFSKYQIDPKTGVLTLPDNATEQDKEALKSDKMTAQEELEKTLFYLDWGIGLKTYKPGIESGTTRIEGGGTAYIGAGFDGGMHDFIGNNEGAWDLEVYVTENTANRRILNQIYNTTKARTTFETICVQFTLSAGPTNLSFFYATPLDRNTHSFAKDMAGLSFSVQQPAKPSVNPSP